MKKIKYSILVILFFLVCILNQRGIRAADETESIIRCNSESLEMKFEEKLPLEELKTCFPDSLSVDLSNGNEVLCEVNWYCLDDYELTEYDIYTFRPEFKRYNLDEQFEAETLPYIEIQIEYKTDIAENETNIENTRYIFSGNSSGKKYINEVLGCDKDIVMYLKTHEKDKYYLTTPYNSNAMNQNKAMSPNGDPTSEGPGMNCTGFVAHVLESCGADLSIIPTYRKKYVGNDGKNVITNLTCWDYFLDPSKNNGLDIKTYRFDSVKDLLNSGKAKKGDLIMFEPSVYGWGEKDKYGNNADCHIGIFWGDTATSNYWWHSSHTLSATTSSGTKAPQGSDMYYAEKIIKGNQLSYIVPKIDGCKVYLIPVKPLTGRLQIKKISSCPEMTNLNNLYSLEGAEFGVYSDADCKNLVTTLTTNSDGISNVVSIQPGTYYIRENIVPAGMKVNPVKDVTYHKKIIIESNKQNVVVIENSPLYSEKQIILHKRDRLSDESLGLSSLENVLFKISYYDGQYEIDNLPEVSKKYWIIQTKRKNDNEYAAELNAEHIISGDDLYSVNGETVWPLGTYKIEEIQSGEGYTLDNIIWKENEEEIDSKFFITHIQKTDDDTLIYVEGNEINVYNEPIRGDVQLKKIDGVSKKPMGNIPFKITSLTTGENHMIITDDKGIYNSKSIPHSTKTNEPIQYAGLWFGLKSDGNMTPVNDQEGALPYDHYLIEELSCEYNKGKKLYTGTFELNDSEIEINLGIIENYNYILRTEVDTKNQLGSHYVSIDTNVTLTDKIQYQGLEENKNYTVVTTLMDCATGKELTDENGQIIKKISQFQTDKANGEIMIEISLNTSNLCGHSIVVFEELYDNEKLLCEHKDMDDENQMFQVLGQIKIHKENQVGSPLQDITFELIDNDGKKIESNSDEKGNLVFSGLKRGEYKLKEKNTKEGYSLLKEEVVIELPVFVPDEQIKGLGLEKERGIYDSEKRGYWFWDFTYTIKNGQLLTMPHTGGVPIVFPAITMITIASVMAKKIDSILE